jgi:hypothetical protein
LEAYTANNCRGSSSTGDGLITSAAHNCYGATNGSGYGVFTDVASNSEGFSGTGFGLRATRIATGCFAQTNSASPALQADGSANGCAAQNFGTGPAIQTCIAIGCSTFGGAVNASCSKWLGTP